jgi:hypothetical protein
LGKTPPPILPNDTVNLPNVVTQPTGPSYVGCYSDLAGGASPTRALPIYAGKFSLSECNAEAKKANAPYFGMQYWEGQNPTVSDKAECWYGTGDANAVLSGAKQFGSIPNSTKCDPYNNNQYGAAYTNAVYKTY